MLDELTRKVRGWLRGEEAPRPTTTVSTPTPGGGVPDAARRLYEAGAQLLREGKPAEALASLDAAAAAHPEYAEAHEQAGLALRELKRHEESLRRFQRAVALRPDFQAAIVHEGIAYLELQRYEDAEDCFKVALAHDQGSAELWTHLAMACWNQRRKGEAIAHFRRALELDAGLVDVHLFLAGLLHEEGRLEEAAESYCRGLTLRPDVPELHANYGVTLLKLSRADEAAAHLEKALALKPDFAEACVGLGNARRDQGRPKEAVACYERAVALMPAHGDAWNNLGSVLKDLGAVERAFDCYRRSAEVNPLSGDPHHNMGVLHNRLGNLGAATACYETALRVHPERPDSALNLAITRLEMGDFQRGWEGYEHRFRLKSHELGVAPRAFPWPRWQGEPLAGKRIFVWGEQGIGDEILFASLYPDVVAAAGGCVIECAPKLGPLFSRSFPGARVIGRGAPPLPDALEGIDLQCPAGSLARWLRPTLASFPRRDGYLVAPASRVAYWRERLASLGPGMTVGFSWRSSNTKGERALVFTHLDQWGPIFGVPGVRFVCLQYDDCREELAAARARFGVDLEAFPEVDLFNDLEEAAALTRAVDLVISAPTAASLLAAALGVPTWQITYGTDWHMHGTDHVPWMPATTRFSRNWDEGWEALVETIAGRLRGYAQQAAAGREPR